MPETKVLKPAGDAKVRRPDNRKHLKPEGEAVEMNSYWARRLAAGEVVEVTAGQPAPKKTGGNK